MKTWTSTSSPTFLWPRDLLPSVVPDAYIYTWGYDISIEEQGSNTAVNFLKNTSTVLLNDISELKAVSDSSALPLLFVAHSLGGSIAKQAYVISTQSGSDTWQAISSSIAGMIFLGTPQQSSAKTSTRQMVSDIFKLYSPSSRSLGTRKVNELSASLDHVNNSFQELLRMRDILLLSCIEGIKSKRSILFSKIIVPAELARIGNEHDETAVIAADHIEMCRFISKDDPGFRTISTRLENWTRTRRDSLQGTSNSISHHLGQFFRSSLSSVGLYSQQPNLISQH